MKSKFYFSIILLSIIFSFCSKVNAQSPDWLWAEAVGGNGYDVATSVTHDALGNIYTTGYFQDTVDFDPGPGVYVMIASGNSDIFISKTDNAGNFIWAKSMGGSGEASAFSIALDGSGNIYTTGYFTYSCDFDPDPVISYNLVSAGIEEAFISKLDSSGNFVWAKLISGIADQRGYSLALDDSANVFTTGYFADTTDFDPGVDTFNITTTGLYWDIYISKLDSSGKFVWAKSFGDSLGGFGYSVVVDAHGNVFTSGFFSGTVDFDPGPGIFNLVSGPWTNTFISKLDNAGNFKMATAFNVSESPFDNYLAVDDSGFMYLTGAFYATADMDPDSSGIFNLNSAGGYDIFIAKYDSLAHFIWAKGMGGIADDWGQCIKLDSSGNIYVAGTFKGNIDMDPDTGVFNITSNGAPRDNFISKFDNSGNFKWAKSIGGTNADVSCYLDLDEAGNIIAAGSYYSSPFSMGQFTFTNPDITLHSCNFFIAELDSVLINGNVEVKNSSDRISIYPNPATKNFIIDFGSNHSKAKTIIFDLTGKIIYEVSTTEKKYLEINATNFSAGIYLVQIKSDNFIETKKLIIE
jgi:hypothetical protein